MIRLAAVDRVVCSEQAWSFFMIKMFQLHWCEVIRFLECFNEWKKNNNKCIGSPCEYDRRPSGRRSWWSCGRGQEELAESWGNQSSPNTGVYKWETSKKKHQTFTGVIITFVSGATFSVVFWAQDQTENNKNRRRVAHIKANMLSTVGFNGGGERREEGAHTSTHTEDPIRCLIISCLVCCHGNNPKEHYR